MNDMTKQEGTVLDGRYKLLEKVGGGGMAEVYKARDMVLNRIVAIKILRDSLASDSDFIERFNKEAQRAAGLSHPNIVSIYDVGETDGLHYIVMEYVSRETLKNKLQVNKSLNVRESLRIVKDIARALAHAHSNNIVHCDIKPHNILVATDGQVKVADFGIARAISSATMSFTGDVVGSVHYFSPEQAQGLAITPKTDVYSLGVVFYELLCGKLPFTGETSVSIALKHLEEEMPSIRKEHPEIPAVVEAIAARALEKEVERRPDANELVELINKAEDELYNSGDEDIDDVTRVLSRADAELLAKSGADNEENAAGRPLYQKLAIVAAVLILLTGGFFAGTYLMLGKFWVVAEVDVPNVVGKQIADAKKIIESEKLRVSVKKVFNADKKPGEVIFQEPEAGRRVKQDRNIVLTVSDGGEMVEMPDVIGLSRRDAQTKLQKVGLKIGNVYEKSKKGEAGNVLEQEPKAKSQILKGSKVDLTISKPELQIVAVPKVIGQMSDLAEATLISKKLKLGTVTEKESKNKPGLVISQDPPSGREVPEGTEVNIVVAKAAKDNANNPVIKGKDGKKKG
ncbi:MAG: Stk1 family PASTA domain-containing Ser/Thr kinase [Selenomonadaceae bacterium]|nr:Stk1 family PASTA domain-containing Ser/Thr kinase [Selenomonadaceae bacterium]